MIVRGCGRRRRRYVRKGFHALSERVRLNDLTFSLAVLKETAQSCAAPGRFESEYKRIEKVFADRLQSTTQQGPRIAFLLQIAQELRKEN